MQYFYNVFTTSQHELKNILQLEKLKISSQTSDNECVYNTFYKLFLCSFENVLKTFSSKKFDKRLKMLWEMNKNFILTMNLKVFAYQKSEM